LTTFTFLQLSIILIAAVFIDTDHWLVYVVKKKDFSVIKAYKWMISLEKLKKKPTFLCIFHTIEFFIIIFLLSLKFEIFKFILLGMAFHMLLDLIAALKEKEYLKQISLIYALVKYGRRNNN
jgi:hypothetical protein